MRSTAMGVLLLTLATACGSSTYGDRAVTSSSPPVQTYEVVVVGSADAQAVADAASILQRRLDGSGVEAAARPIDGRIEIEMFDDGVGRDRIESLLVVGQLEFRPVLAEHPGEIGTEDGMPLRQVLISPGACRAPRGPDESASDEPMLSPACLPGVEEPQGVFELGPAVLTGSGVESASAQLTQQGMWTVQPVLLAGADGIDAFNAAAASCADRASGCPTGRLAVVLDGKVLLAPAVQQPTFERDQIQIGGDLTEQSARDLAAVLASNSLPVELGLAG
jgi:preprotein translocase subunit SecD